MESERGNKMKQKYQHSFGLRLTVSVLALLLLVSCIVTSVCFQFPKEVNVILGTASSKLVDNEGDETIQYERHYTDEELEQAYLETNVQTAEEGVVLLKNDGALPLNQGATVSFFGIGAGNIVKFGASSGYGFATGADLCGALENNGINVNRTIFDWFKNRTPAGYLGISGGAGNSTNDNLKIDELPRATVESEGADALASVKPEDIGIFVVTRRAGEGAIDLKSHDGADFDNYLELNEEEKDMLRLMKERTDKQIVLINSNNAISLEFMEDSDLGVDAVLWMPYVAEGIQGVANVLTGVESPSGKLIDTWAACTYSAPAMQNLELNQWTNYEDVLTGTGSSMQSAQDYSYLWTDAFLIYQEGIYVGYKYYETRYEDLVMGRGNADSSAGVSDSLGYGNTWNYEEEVNRPFGFGLSYTTFQQELLGVSDELTEEETGEKYFEVRVRSANTGNVAGKDVIEVYFQQPYFAGGIEKSAICLGGFAKTEKLEPGESQEVSVKVYKRDMASYDYQDAKTYVFESGEYYFSIGSDVHDALNNILADKGYDLGDADKCEKMNMDEDDSFSVSEQGAEITNRLQQGDINYYYPDVKYLSRSDWEGTYPETLKLEATEEIITDLKNPDYTPKTDEADEIEEKYPDYKNGNGGEMTLAMMKGVEFDSELWDDLIDQLSLEELTALNTNGYPGTAAVESIAKPEGNALNGPTGHIASGDVQGYIFAPAVLFSATWNVEMAEKLGELIAEDGLRIERTGIMGPGVNIHRTPYSGRNFEYFSEDGVFSGIMVQHEIEAYLNVGGEVYVKHFAFNDQETHRFGVAVFGNEQAFREIYLKPFEYAFNKATCNFVMTSYNRVGCTWTGASTALLQDILRGEWGFDGVISTDNITMALGYADPLGGKFAGIDNWRNRQNALIGEVYGEYAGTDLKLYEQMRECAKYILYTSANSVCMNGVSASSHVVKITPYWVPLTIGITAVLGIAVLIAGISLVIVENRKTRKADALRREKE